MPKETKPRITRQQRSVLIKRMERAEEARLKVGDDWLVTISETMDAGLSGADIAFIVGSITESTIHQRRKQGAQIRSDRDGGSAGGSGE